jgi:hypothetical protein
MKALGLVLYSLLFTFLGFGLVIPSGDPAPRAVIQFQGYRRVSKARGALLGCPKRGKRHSGAFSRRQPGAVILDRSREAVIL